MKKAIVCTAADIGNYADKILTKPETQAWVADWKKLKLQPPSWKNIISGTVEPKPAFALPEYDEAVNKMLAQEPVPAKWTKATTDAYLLKMAQTKSKVIDQHWAEVIEQQIQPGPYSADPNYVALVKEWNAQWEADQAAVWPKANASGKKAVKVVIQPRPQALKKAQRHRDSSPGVRGTRI